MYTLSIKLDAMHIISNCFIQTYNLLFFPADELEESKAVPENLTFHKPGWFENVETEYWACREGVCLIDMSSFTKYELKVSLFP
jgi:hypothetical protein